MAAAYEREKQVEHYLATTTPEQRKRERRATLLRLRGETA
jgi:hypothetical protein